MTIHEIKERTKKTNPHFFSRDTMKFFNQTLKDFKVKKIKRKRIFNFCSFLLGWQINGKYYASI